MWLSASAHSAHHFHRIFHRGDGFHHLAHLLELFQHAVHFDNRGSGAFRYALTTALAYNIDNSDNPYILGTIAGDDTIFIVIKQGVRDEDVIEALRNAIPNIA